LDAIYAKHSKIISELLEKLNFALSEALKEPNTWRALVAKLRLKVGEGARTISEADVRKLLLPGTPELAN